MNEQNMPPKPIYVYVLTDPRYPSDVRYVGITNNPKQRLKDHIQKSKRGKTHKASWIKSLLNDGLKPAMTTIDETDEDNWQQCEIAWIAYYREMGCDLVNGTDGGEGCINPSEDTRKRLSESNPRKKRIVQYDKFGHFIRNWDSAGQAGVALGIARTNITDCCQRKPRYHTAGGFIWRYADDPLLLEQPRLF